MSNAHIGLLCLGVSVLVFGYIIARTRVYWWGWGNDHFALMASGTLAFSFFSIGAVCLLYGAEPEPEHLWLIPVVLGTIVGALATLVSFLVEMVCGRRRPKDGSMEGIFD